jgi:hypothetical protein
MPVQGDYLYACSVTKITMQMSSLSQEVDP